MQTNPCKICANTEGNQVVTAREMMFGLRDEFTYLKCAACGCLQIMTPPEDLSRYYPADKYYSFHTSETPASKKEKVKNLLKYTLWKAWRHLHVPAQNLPHIRNFAWLNLLRGQITATTPIADVGCGNGLLLQQMRAWGFKNLTGIDPFIEKNILHYQNINIWKTDIYNYPPPSQYIENELVTNKFEIIMLHHSFEHMDNPREALNQLYKMLNPEGLLLIRIPVADSFAWRKYGVNWFQLDAPRHFFLHTTKSIALLAKGCGFTLKHVLYDSTASQFINSEKYVRDISLFEPVKMSQAYEKSCAKQAKQLNRMLDGDMACFVLEKQTNK